MKKLLLLAPVFFLAASCTIPGLNVLGGNRGPVGGILKSVDSGETWERADKLEGEGTLSGASIARLRFDPERADQLYAASPTAGLYISTNKSGTWKPLLAGAAVFDLQINPQNRNELLAGGQANSIAKVFKSTDAGQTWIEVYSESKPGSVVSAILYLPGGSQRVLAALSTGEILHSANNGSSWNLHSKLAGRVVRLDTAPNTPTLLYALELQMGLSRSRDGGTTWESITKGKLEGPFYEFKIPKALPNTLYVATAKGLYRSTDGGSTWYPLPFPLHAASSIVSAVEVNPVDPRMIFATINGVLYSSKDAGASWKTKGLNTALSVRQIAADPNEPTTMYAALGQPLR